MREFLCVDDMAQGVVFALENKLSEYLYNIGTGKDITIKELAETIQKVIGHQGNILWDASKPDGTPRKLMDVSKMKTLGWEYSIELEASNYIQAIENRQGLKVACLEEIAYQKEYINKEQLVALAEPLKKNGYGQYLLEIAKEKEVHPIY